MGSLYEFIYTFRDSVKDPFPDLLSKNTETALKMMKTLKNEISSGSYNINNNYYYYFYI